MPYFTGLIKCTNCGHNYKSKKERGKRKYICGSYDLNRGCNKRLPVEEDFLLELLEHRLEKKLTEEDIQNIVDYIEIIDRKIIRKTKRPLYKLNIYFKNGDKPIKLEEKFMQF